MQVERARPRGYDRAMGRSGAALILASVLGLLATVPAEAVFPGSKGRFTLGNSIYAPPNPEPAVPSSAFGGLFNLRFSPDGTRVVGNKRVGPSLNRYSVWVANADGSGARQLTTPDGDGERDEYPTWSPDGTEVAIARLEFVTSGCRNPNSSLCGSGSIERINVESGARRVVVAPSTSWFYRYPEWSPDGSTIVTGAVETETSGQEWNGVHLVDLATGTRRRLTPLRWFVSARFSPDGTKLVSGYGTLGDGREFPEIRVVEASNPGATLLSFDTAQRALGALPTFTPDGRAVTWGDCRPQCGVYSHELPQPGQPGPGSVRQDLALSSARPDSPVDWEPLVDAPIITGGPQGRVGRADAAFEFAVPTNQLGRYECRLVELATWEQCTSPKTYAGLPDGEHRFEVRFVVQDDPTPDDSPVATRTWTSDTSPPVALIDQAPSGSTSAAEATFVFRSTEPDGASFRCSVDGAAEQECSSPVRVTALGEGEHSFAVRATDDVGNDQENATRVTWTVRFPPAGAGGTGGASGGGSGGGATPPGGPTQPCATRRVEAGVVIAIGRCFDKRRDDGRDVYVTRGPISLNGIRITPAVGTSIVIDPRLSDVDVRWTGPVTMGFAEVTWTVPFALTLPIGKANTAAKFALPAFEKLQGKLKVAGLKVAVAPQFELTGDDGGSTKVGLKIALPSSFRGLKDDGSTNDDKAGGLTFEFAWTSSNEKDTRFALKGQVDTAWLWSKVKLTDVGISLDSGPPLAFEATATLALNPSQLPTGISREQQFTAAIGFTQEGGQWPNLRKVAIQASKFQKPLAYGFFLQRFGGEFTACGGAGGGAGQFSANAGVSFGPRFDIKPIFEGEAVSLDGKVALTLCKEQVLEVTGEGKVIEVKVANGSVKFPFDGNPELSGELDVSIGGYGYRARISESWFALKQRKFNLQASAELRLPGLIGGLASGQSDTVLSSTGFAACFGRPQRRIGLGKRWGASLEKFASARDVGDFRAIASTGQVPGASRTAVIRPGTNLAVIELRGSGGAPKVTLAGPGGRTVVVPAGPEVLQISQVLVVQDPGEQATYIVLFDPPPGTWSATPSPLSAPLAGLRMAEGLPPVAVRATSRRLGGERRLLRWKLAARPGQEVTFVEIGASTTKVLTTTSRNAGTLRYVPETGAGRARRLEAVVTQDGLPRARRVLARYSVAQPRTARPGRARLRGRAVVWQQPGGATSWSILLRSADGRTQALESRRPRVALPKGWPRRGVTVLVVGLGADGRTSPRRTTLLRG